MSHAFVLFRVNLESMCWLLLIKGKLIIKLF
jgi:hypothetical protein